MATLNVKNFPEDLYERIRERAAAERRSIAREVVSLLEEAVRQAEPGSLLELRGLGRKTWKGVDAASFVAEERDSWG